MNIKGIKKISTFDGDTSVLVDGTLAGYQLQITTPNPVAAVGDVRMITNALCGDDGLLPAEHRMINFAIDRYAGETFNNIPYEDLIGAIKKVWEQAYADAVAAAAAQVETEGVE